MWQGLLHFILIWSSLYLFLRFKEKNLCQLFTDIIFLKFRTLCFFNIKLFVKLHHTKLKKYKACPYYIPELPKNLILKNSLKKKIYIYR